MEHRHLGPIRVLVSELCLSTMSFGPVTVEQAPHDILAAALDAR